MSRQTAMKFAATVFLAAYAFSSLAYGQTVSFYTTKSCASPSEVFENVGCNVCVDPPGGMLLRLSTASHC